MNRITNLILITILFIAANDISVLAQAKDGKVLVMMNEYFELLSSDNLEIAQDMWSPEALERSSRFGIKFTDIPMKTDAGSPVIQNLKMVSFVGGPAIKKYEAMADDSWSRIEYAGIIGSSYNQHYYYAQRRGDWYWLGYPQDYYTSRWSVLESHYFRIHTDQPVEKYLNRAVLEQADKFVERMADTLGIPKSALKNIATRKIEYYYCAADTTVKRITGQLVQGILDLASNDIISASFPHFHEITHLLVNIRLLELPYQTLPIMREGLAVRYGGRWGKQPSALLDLGVFLYQEELINLDSTLTRKGFMSEAGADIVYPVAGLFSAYLLDNLGNKKLFELYLKLSGSFNNLDAMTTDSIQTDITKATGFKSWDKLRIDFDDFCDKRLDKHMMAKPGSISGGKIVLDEDLLTVKEDKTWLSFEFGTFDKRETPGGSFFFAPCNDLKDGNSALFDQQFHGDETFDAYRFAVRFDRNEVGLYDYATNQLVAKYIWGITPSDDYYDETQNRIRIMFKKTLLGKKVPEKGKYKLLPI